MKKVKVPCKTRDSPYVIKEGMMFLILSDFEKTIHRQIPSGFKKLRVAQTVF